MNERIRELADQAEDYATAEYEKWIPTPDFSGIPNVRKIFNEKFAELIVQECILTIQMGITRDGPTTEKFLRSMKHIKQIKEHFGVEE